MVQTEAQRRTSLAYVKRSVTQKVVKFYPADSELLAWLFWRSVNLTGNQTKTSS